MYVLVSNNNTYMYTPPFKSLRLVRFYNVFESFLCSPRLYLFDDKYNKCEIILQFKITVLRKI